MHATDPRSFDVPAAFDYELLIASLKRLKDGRRIDVPVYDFTTHSRSKQSVTMYGANVIVFEGVLCRIYLWHSALQAFWPSRTPSCVR